MISNEEFGKLYNELFADCKSLSDEKMVLENLKGENKDELRQIYCNNMLYYISQGYTKYDIARFDKDEFIQTFLYVIEMLPENCSYYHMIYYFFKKDNKQFLSSIEEYIECLYIDCKEEIKKPEDFINEGVFIDMFFEPLKQGVEGLWSHLGRILKKYPTQEGIPELCELVEHYYYKCKTDNDALEFLLDMMQKYPDFILIKELVGYTYYSMKMWNNAIAYFESVEDTGLFFIKKDLYFMLAWSYGKIKKHKTEAIYYRKAIEIVPNNINFLNNLGYCLYQQKQYTQAIEYFNQCLDLDPKYVYAANNYVRVLLALGRNKDAKIFVKSGKYKIAKDIIRRVEKASNTNARLKKEQTNEADNIFDDESSQINAVDLGIKREQFSNEKLLEDELSARIESGVEVFGLKLKMYKRKGLYGRQFVIPVGRLDLLCEDEKGNLYVIELKKDSGYDDVYKQTALYLDWFEKNDISKGKNVYGIICLNSPTNELIEKVHKDKRMRLFEYQISYTEI